MAPKLSHAAIVAAALLVAGPAYSQYESSSQVRPDAAMLDEDSQGIFGAELMTAEERQEYQEKMRDLDTEAERREFKEQHKSKMRARADQRGVELTEEEGRIDLAQRPDTPTDERGGVGRDTAGSGTGVTGMGQGQGTDRDVTGTGAPGTDRGTTGSDRDWSDTGDRSTTDPAMTPGQDTSPGTTTPGQGTGQGSDMGSGMEDDRPSGTWPPGGAESPQ